MDRRFVSVPGFNLEDMPTESASLPGGPTGPRTTAATTDAAAANEAIRDYVRRHGSRPWGAAERAELGRLYAAWRAAVKEGLGAAA
ncbi:hypothetical protein [Streptomyces alkaliphilus]|uniref:hypothetical protein n=1 Tax=Streptomyces alkaliphilus TaxID=1472722 RepID=UPI00117D9B66|nr:hypothetical protein [Streptomyces alkaliphilus]MQS06558.1 hypothetical protein [Streptomyces alkaliphilus]